MDREPNDPGFSVKPATALGYSIVCNMGGDRQMTVQCFVGEDEPDEVVNGKLDRAFRVVDRIKARYDLERHYKEFEEAGRHLRNFLNAIPIADKNAQYQLAALKVELTTKEEARKEVFDQGYNEHASSGRRGSFTPKGSLQSRLVAMDADIAKVREKIDAVPADTEQHKAKCLIDIQRYQDDLHKRRVAINDLRALAGLEPYVEFLVEETASPLEVKGA